jgi:hypothetical protein
MKKIPWCQFLHSPVTVLELVGYKTETRRKREFQQNWALAPSYIRWNSLLRSSLYSYRFFAMAQHMLTNGEFDKLKAHLEVMKTAADARKADADAQTSRAKARTAHIDTHAKLIDALSGHQASKVDSAVKLGQLHNDTVATHAGAYRDIAAAHKDHATAHRERVGADAMQPAYSRTAT